MPVVVGSHVTRVLVVDLLRAVARIVLLIGKIAREKQVSVELLLNYCLHNFNLQKDELAAAKVLCAQIYFLLGSLIAREECVWMADAECKRT